jgi:hypothetical protein
MYDCTGKFVSTTSMSHLLLSGYDQKIGLRSRSTTPRSGACSRMCRAAVMPPRPPAAITGRRLPDRGSSVPAGFMLSGCAQRGAAKATAAAAPACRNVLRVSFIETPFHRHSQLAPMRRRADGRLVYPF